MLSELFAHVIEPTFEENHLAQDELHSVLVGRCRNQHGGEVHFYDISTSEFSWVCDSQVAFSDFCKQPDEVARVNRQSFMNDLPVHSAFAIKAFICQGNWSLIVFSTGCTNAGSTGETFFSGKCQCRKPLGVLVVRHGFG